MMAATSSNRRKPNLLSKYARANSSTSIVSVATESYNGSIEGRDEMVSICSVKTERKQNHLSIYMQPQRSSSTFSIVELRDDCRDEIGPARSFCSVVTEANNQEEVEVREEAEALEVVRTESHSVATEENYREQPIEVARVPSYRSFCSIATDKGSKGAAEDEVSLSSSKCSKGSLSSRLSRASKGLVKKINSSKKKQEKNNIEKRDDSPPSPPVASISITLDNVDGGKVGAGVDNNLADEHNIAALPEPPRIDDEPLVLDVDKAKEQSKLTQQSEKSEQNKQGKQKKQKIKKEGQTKLKKSQSGSTQQKQQKQSNKSDSKNKNQNKSETLTVTAEDAADDMTPAPNWNGRIVGLRLPKEIDPAFDETAKPIERRVDPTPYIQKNLQIKVAEENQPSVQNYGPSGWNPWNESSSGCMQQESAMILDVEDSDEVDAVTVHATCPSNDDKCQVALDVYLFDQSNGADAKRTVKLHMVRDPKEETFKTLQRLKISLEKKLAKKKKKNKGKKPGKGKVNSDADRHDKPFIYRKKMQPVTEPEEHSTFGDDVWNGNIFREEFFEGMPINFCNPLQQPELISAEDTKSASKPDQCSMDDYVESENENSITINEFFASASEQECGQYVISVPVEVEESKTIQVPLMLDSCPPTITSVATFGSFDHTRIFERTPVVIEVGLLYATKAKIMWYADSELVCPDSHCYAPTQSDVGKTLTVVIVPMRSFHNGHGCEEAYQFRRPVEELPSMPILTPLRDNFRGQKDSDPQALRVMTYNILADQNASRDVEKEDEDNRVYSHCLLEHIEKWRRHPLIVHEILEYQPDVVCLQEVDTDVFEDFLEPVLNAKGYQGHYSQKGVDEDSGVREGCAIFWSLDVFERVRSVDAKTHTFREMCVQFMCDERMHKSQWKSMNDVSDLLDKHNHLKHILFNKLGHVMQTVVLTNKKNKEKVVVGNTHLFYHPMASHIRCLKMLIACRQLEIEHKENGHCPIIFCGDLNSPPDSGVMGLLLNRFLESNCEKTWEHLCTYEWEEGAIGDLHHGIEAIDLEFPPSFPKMISAYQDPPEFTHFIEVFVCTLDYILASSNFKVLKSAATPAFDDVKKFIAMPNECMPSDHISLVTDLKWS